MRLLIDGDSCPVKDIITEIAKNYGLKVILVASINHVTYEQDIEEVIYVDARNQEADMVIINNSYPRDIIVTNDYGLASILIEKNCFCLSPNGYIFNKENIDGLLEQRYISMKLRKGGYKVKGPKKRKKEDDERFRKGLIHLIETKNDVKD